MKYFLSSLNVALVWMDAASLPLQRWKDRTEGEQYWSKLRMGPRAWTQDSSSVVSQTKTISTLMLELGNHPVLEAAGHIQ